MPNQGSIVLMGMGSSADFNQGCLQLCADEERCVGFDNNIFPDGQGGMAWTCTLYSKITGVSQGWGTSNLKVCAVAGGSNSVSSSSVANSIASLSSAATSTVLVSSPPSSSIASSSSVLEVPSSTLSATPSPTPSAPACPYASSSTCTATTALTLDGCPAQDYACASGYQARCGLKVTYAGGAGGFDDIRPTSIDVCIATCDANPNCYAFSYAYVGTYYQKACLYYGPGVQLVPFREGEGEEPDYLVSLKLCPGEGKTRRVLA
ncbi:hypothetical protein T440DRAFT_516409 [Plenodomus tracheiphilus IPT5]|uniref:Apple domain-containing protein n=1 Tax=Plenodomus tracheiphilus IPT5 TaxID=1408161 RepID=A0A6A7BDW5_9PLEO|nr:hypothetical protein T440DRAFT_516409 [Plenodomus tracheiphilus IPT5]